MGSLLRPDQGGCPHILYIDAFDSFANNITGLLEQRLGAHVTLVHTNDLAVDQNLEQVLKTVDAVVVGPGPGHPGNPNDVGFIPELWSLDDTHMLPVLGICLGFQSLSLAHGADVKRLKSPRHGIVTRVSHRGDDIFSDLSEELEATQYHSLHADIGGTGVADGGVAWQPTQKCPELRPMAWDEGDMTNGKVLMGVRHTTKPFWGVQFHPESICTSTAGAELVGNWWALAKEWLTKRGRTKTTDIDLAKWLPASETQLSDPTACHMSSCSHLAREIRSSLGGEHDISLSWERYPAPQNLTATALLDKLGHNANQEVVVLDSQGHGAGRFDILGVVIPGQTIKVTYRVADRTLRYGYGPETTQTSELSSIDEVWPMLQEALDLHAPQNGNRADQSLLRFNDMRTAPQDVPFWGGFMGYISYEAGLETIDVERAYADSPLPDSSAPDVNFAFIHRSIVIDRSCSQVYVQSLLPNDQDWILATGNKIQSLTGMKADIDTSNLPTPSPTPSPPNNTPATPLPPFSNPLLTKTLATATTTRPSAAVYQSKVRQCQDYLHSGDSYELCLTDTSTISLDKPIDPWTWYKTRLRTRNPAPHGAYLHLSGVYVLSSSPERFLRWTRQEAGGAGGLCEFRPIKGTVQKRKKNVEMEDVENKDEDARINVDLDENNKNSKKRKRETGVGNPGDQKREEEEMNGEGDGGTITRAEAEVILGTAKERAENLMIVDLIRHDLAGAVGAGNVWVSQLMKVEEFATVWHLVSVVQGRLGSTARGIDVLRRSLPPGSMTGAPKKRSCEILTRIEGRPRGVYSGVLGYMDVGGGGDFSVVIRTAVHYAEDQDDTREGELWRVGAGGAITVQSDEVGEFLEMETKASSVLDALLGKDGC